MRCSRLNDLTHLRTVIFIVFLPLSNPRYSESSIWHGNIATLTFIVCEKENNIIAISNDVETVVCLSLSRQFARFKLNISISIEILFVHFSVYLQSKKKNQQHQGGLRRRKNRNLIPKIQVQESHS